MRITAPAKDAVHLSIVTASNIVDRVIHTDICVVGAGVSGLTIARALGMSGADVTVLERGKAGAGAAHVAAGMLSPLVEARLEEREVVSFGRACLEYWPEFAERIQAEVGESIDYRTEGTLVVGVERDHLSAINHLYSEQRELGLPADRLSGYECRRLEPYLSPNVSEGLFFPLDHQVDNRSLLRSLVRSCRDVHKSVRLLDGQGTARLFREGDGSWRVETDEVSVEASRVVIATGASLGLLHEVAPDMRKLVRPVKGQIARLDQSGMHVLDHVVRTPEVYLVPKSDGSLTVGASSEDRGFDDSITLGPIFELFRAAWECLPALYELPVVETNVGFRPASIDHAPLLGPTRLDGLYLATGYYRHGVLFAPLAAELLAQTILTDTIDERIRDFSPNRFDSVDAERQSD